MPEGCVMSCDVSCDLGGGEVGVERVESSLGFFLVLKSFIVSSMERWSLLLALGTGEGEGKEGGRERAREGGTREAGWKKREGGRVEGIEQGSGWNANEGGRVEKEGGRVEVIEQGKGERGRQGGQRGREEGIEQGKGDEGGRVEKEGGRKG